MTPTDEIRRRALRAARAVTMSAAIVAAGCSADDPSEPNSGWNLTESDASADTSADVADAAQATCSGEPDEVCPERCHDMNDVDCCEQIGGIWSHGSCGIPGPFVPPSMIG